MDLHAIIGQRLVFGFQGPALTESFRQLVRQYKIGNVILFRHNVVDNAQLRALCADIQQLVQSETGHPAFITIDQEGGMVSRLGADAVVTPGNMAVAATGDPVSARIAAQITARQLRGLGVNLNLAPVLDVNSNARNPVIGVRSFGDDPTRVADFAREAVLGYQNENVCCCGKHFPGHGDTAVDSHIGLPCVGKDLPALEACELLPFRAAIKGGIPAIMSSHILFPRLEPDGVPATMSRRIMHDLLRGQLGFDGLILSDCMCMDAIQRHYGTPQGALAAMNAGVDLVFVSSNETLQRETAEYLRAAAQEGRLDETQAQASMERILRAKERYAFTSAQPELVGLIPDREAAEWMLRRAITHVSGPLFQPDERTFFCGPEDYRASLAGNAASAMEAAPLLLRRCYGGGAAVCGKDPDEDEIARLTAQAADYDSILLLTCNGHLFPGQIALARALHALSKPMMAAALRNPYDLPLLPDIGKIAVYDYFPAALRALIAALDSGHFYGRLPVHLEESV